ncbi:UNVERIFIED_CONTAM: Prefoldin subunit [Sesamum radiatum]|uniref:Prefoldin subunit n=1 Tax=Sesamum radiatum TaxID=300843 RepID=A0AAW2T1R6_SESRA
MAAVKELQRDLENKANDLNKLQKDIAKNHQVRKKYTIQLGENELVLKELDLLNEEANVYKLIGPVLVKQDLAEANANVRKRIDYISAELYALFSLLIHVCRKTFCHFERTSYAYCMLDACSYAMITS